MKLKLFLPLLLVVSVGCDSADEKQASNDSLKYRFEQKEPKVDKTVIKKTGHDQAVVPETNYPSIFEVEIPENKENSSDKDNKKAKQVLNIGKEKIKVYDESMGSVNEDSLKKLRQQVK